jgi:hypothetical protein
LDDDCASPVLARRLRNDGHDVQLPGEAGLPGKKDPVHLLHAITNERALLTRNYGDFEDLHNLVVIAHGHHFGVLVIRQENDPARDMSPRAIVRSIHNLFAAGVPIADCFHVLNHWR